MTSYESVHPAFDRADSGYESQGMLEPRVGYATYQNLAGPSQFT